jgi:eukaryotic-like serine/threonine-protein kinase
MALTPGQKLQNGKYTIERELGRGRYMITYLAKLADGERRVIKILNPQVLSALSQTDRERLETKFLQEGTKLTRCSGTPHIVKVYDPFKEKTFVCLPLEYMEGRSLAERSQPILSEAKALEYIRQMGEALAVVHKEKLVHCDIRPANIFLRIPDRNVEAVLADFGFSLDIGTKTTRTRKKERIDGFSPPELYSSGQEVGAYTDVYSLAATLYELLTGDAPISAEDRSLNGRGLIPPRTKNPNISGNTNQAILEGMELRPNDRPQSMSDWMNRLNLTLESLGGTKNTINWQTVWMAIGAVAGAIVSVVTIVNLLNTKPPTIPTVKPSLSVSP